MTATHKHHRKRRSQGGDDSYGNLIELDPLTHELVHKHPEKAYEYGLLVKSHDDPSGIRPDLSGFLDALGLQTVTEKPTSRRRLAGEERRKRRTISVKVPNDEENGGEVWDDTLERVKERLVAAGLYSADDQIPIYEALIAALNDWLNS